LYIPVRILIFSRYQDVIQPNNRFMLALSGKLALIGQEQRSSERIPEVKMASARPELKVLVEMTGFAL
jgi:hypothetical protein